MSVPYRPGGVTYAHGPFEGVEISNHQLLSVPVKHTVYLRIAEVEGGYLLDIANKGNQLCIGAESIEAGVRAVITHLVTQGLEK